MHEWRAVACISDVSGEAFDVVHLVRFFAFSQFGWMKVAVEPADGENVVSRFCVSAELD
jgi:hypothetical protein